MEKEASAVAGKGFFQVGRFQPRNNLAVQLHRHVNVNLPLLDGLKQTELNSRSVDVSCYPGVQHTRVVVKETNHKNM